MLREALGLYRTAIEIAPEGSRDQGVVMVNLVSACRDANERHPNSALLDEALARGGEALKLFSAPDLHRAAALTAVGNAQRDRYLETGSLSDLDEARGRAEEASAQARAFVDAHRHDSPTQIARSAATRVKRFLDDAADGDPLALGVVSLAGVALAGGGITSLVRLARTDRRQSFQTQ